MSFTRCSVLAVLVLAATQAPALAQFVQGQNPPPRVQNVPPPAPSTAPTPPPSVAPPVPYPGTYPGYATSYYDPYGGYFRGVGDLVSSYGQYGKDYNQARLLNQQVEQEKIKTRQMLQEQRRYEQSQLPTAEDIRDRDRQYALRRAMNDPPLTEILSGSALNDLLKNAELLMTKGTRGPTVPLDAEVLDHIHVSGGRTSGSVGVIKDGGRLRWPLPLQDTPFEKDRKHMDEVMYQAVREVSDEQLQLSTVRDLEGTLKSMQGTLDRIGRDMAVMDIVEVQRYFTELESSIKALRDPSAANFFSKKWSAQGRDVAELVANMSREGLRFAPAIDGDEAAYQVLHRSLVSYNLGAQQVAQK
jgi:hypothetical protein